MIRRSLAKPIPAGIPYSDWWFAICAAETTELQYLPEALALYREHGANLTSGTSGAAGVREHRKEIAFQLWALRNLDLTSLAPAEIELVWRGVEIHAARAMSAANTHFVALVEVTAADRGQAESAAVQADEAAARQEFELESALLLRALGWNPYDAELQTRLHAASGRMRQLQGSS
jgi:hypothetical protein